MRTRRSRPLRLSAAALAALLFSAMLPGSVAGAQMQPAEADDDGSARLIELLEQVINENRGLRDEINSLREELNELRTALPQPAPRPQLPDDLAELIARMSSDDYDERVAASRAVRLAIVERIWSAIADGAHPPETKARLRSIAVEAAGLLQLTPMLVGRDLEVQDAIWRLYDEHATWLFDAIGGRDEAMTSALRRPPENHDLAISHIYAWLIADSSDEMRRLEALAGCPATGHHVLLDAVVAVCRVAPDRSARMREHPILGRNFYSYEFTLMTARRDLAFEALVRCDPQRTVAWLLAALDSMQQSGDGIDMKLAQQLVDRAAIDAVPRLLEISRRKRAENGSSRGWNNVQVASGDVELITAARLLNMDLSEMGITSQDFGNGTIFGFIQPQNMDQNGWESIKKKRDDAFEKVLARCEELADTFQPVPGLDEVASLLQREGGSIE